MSGGIQGDVNDTFFGFVIVEGKVYPLSLFGIGIAGDDFKFEYPVLPEGEIRGFTGNLH